MGEGRDVDYKTGRKNQWRRWAWKEVAKRVDNPKTAKVLYLAAREDHDRGVAVSYGFHPDNLYAVDNDKEVVNKLKSDGKLVICGDFIEVAFADYRYFDVMYADFCGGITERTLRLALLLSRTAMKKRVVMVNMLRGRDKPQLYKRIYKKVINLTCDKTRGHYFLYSFIAEALNYSLSAVWSMSRIVQIATYKKLFKELNAVGRSYKSDRGNQYFDSIVITVPKLFSDLGPDRDMKSSKMYRNLAALKAVSTMRHNGRLNHSPRW